MAEDKETLVALQAFVGHDGKEDRLFREGDPVRDTDPAVKKWPHLFGPARYYNQPSGGQVPPVPGRKQSA